MTVDSHLESNRLLFALEDEYRNFISRESMSADVELLNAEHAISQYYLPWTKLFGDRKHLATCHPGWWQACLALHDASVSPSALPYVAIVQHSNQIIGLLPVQRLRNDEFYPKTRWQLDLSPFCAGGVIGAQATATLNVVIRQLQSQSQQSHGWQLHIDASDSYLNNRLQTAFSLASLSPSKGRPVPAGWDIKRKNADVGKPGTTVQLDLETTFDATWKLHAIATGLGNYNPQWQLSDIRPLVSYSLQRDGFHWACVGDESQKTWVGFWDLETSRNLSGQQINFNTGSWMPWCVISQVADPLADPRFWPNVFDNTLPAGLSHMVVPNEFVRTSSTSASHPSCRNPMTSSCSPLPLQQSPLGIDAGDHSYSVSRWLIQERTFQRPSIWSKIWHREDHKLSAT